MRNLQTRSSKNVQKLLRDGEMLQRQFWKKAPRSRRQLFEAVSARFERNFLRKTGFEQATFSIVIENYRLRDFPAAVRAM